MSWPMWFLLCIVPAVLMIVVAYRTGQTEALQRDMEAREHSTSKGQQGLVFFAPLIIGGFIGFYAAAIVPAMMTLAGNPGIRTVCFLLPSCSWRAERELAKDASKSITPDRARLIAVQKVLDNLRADMRGKPGHSLDSLEKSLQWISAFTWAYAALLWSLPLMRLAIGAAALAGGLWLAWFVVKTIWLTMLSMF